LAPSGNFSADALAPEDFKIGICCMLLLKRIAQRMKKQNRLYKKLIKSIKELSKHNNIKQHKNQLFLFCFLLLFPLLYSFFKKLKMTPFFPLKDFY